MEATRCWFNKFRSKDKSKSSKNNETTPNGKERSKAPVMDETPSTATKQKVAAAKQYIEKHYKEQMKNLQERKERYGLYAPFLFVICHFYTIYSVSIVIVYYSEAYRVVVVLGCTNSSSRYKRFLVVVLHAACYGYLTDYLTFIFVDVSGTFFKCGIRCPYICKIL